ncbi:MAG TPA: hypothetical protein VK639_09735, partial [Terriglobales bacterium]|nr:hypothetical protein [Terriglobales bacterium]
PVIVGGELSSIFTNLDAKTCDPLVGDSLSTLVTGASPRIFATIDVSNGPAELTWNAPAYA